MYPFLDKDRMDAMGDKKAFECSDEFLRAERETIEKDIDALNEIADRYIPDSEDHELYSNASHFIKGIARILERYINQDLYNFTPEPVDKRHLLSQHYSAYLAIREHILKFKACSAPEDFPNEIDMRAVKDILLARIERMDWFPDHEMKTTVKSLLDINVKLEF